MQLRSVRVVSFRSIEDSEEFEVKDLTCLVGKNEAGKTAILHALYGLNPVSPFEFDKIRDYPRRHLAKFDTRHPDGYSKVIVTKWELSDEQQVRLAQVLGPETITSKEFNVEKGIGSTTRNWTVHVDEQACLKHFAEKHKLDSATKKTILAATSTVQAAKLLESSPDTTDAQKALLAELKAFRGCSVTLALIDSLQKLLPKFFYTSHFERMSGEVSLEKVKADQASKALQVGDRIFLDFLEYAGTTIQELEEASRYEELKAQCEAASNEITDEIFEFWSQNEALSVKIELGQGKKDDPPPFNTGTVAKIRIENQNHRVSVPLSERSAGFVWFFSFLSQFKQLKKTAGNAIILLDEPGLTLHGKAQSDLLRYIQERLLPHHQVIYSTHSPFMVPAERLSDVRVVEDVIERPPQGRIIVKGTKVSADVLSVDKDTLFPLQGHLGYEITQSLFIGKDTILVEGPSDILYLQIFSQALKSLKRTGLDARWTICPTGGIDKVWSFASLFGGNKINIAVLCDYGAGDKSKVERLKQSQLLKTSQILTTSDFTGKTESDVEDLLDPTLFARLLNKAFTLPKEQALSDDALLELNTKQVRIVKGAEKLFMTMPPSIAEFDHYTPAEWLLRNPGFIKPTDAACARTLDSFEQVFIVFNKLLTSKGIPTAV